MGAAGKGFARHISRWDGHRGLHALKKQK